MTAPTIEKKVIKFEEGINLTEIEFRPGDIFEIDGRTEIIAGRVTIFRTAKREGEAIVETGYTINSQGKLESLFSGIYYNIDTPPFHASARYSELNKLLEEHEK